MLNIGTVIGLIKSSLTGVKNEINGKYTKPQTGIPASDIAEGVIQTVPSIATSEQIKEGTDSTHPLAPVRQHESAFYALAKAAGADMKNSSNPVGTFTPEAMTAIQKMLGIYEAPWELIRDDEFTFATESNLIIDVDDNGDSFELTDVRGIVWIPTQNNEAKCAAGYVGLKNGNTSLKAIAIDTKTATANSTACCAYFMMEQKNGMMFHQSTGWHNKLVMGQVRMTLCYDSDNGSYQFTLISETPVTELYIPKLTGTFKVRVYGKRKWRT